MQQRAMQNGKLLCHINHLMEQMKQHMTAKTYISIFQKHVTKLVLILCSQDMIMLMQEQIH